MGFGAEEAREFAVSGRGRLVGGDGEAAEHQGPRAHPWDNSSWHEAARGGSATCAGGRSRRLHGGGGAPGDGEAGGGWYGVGETTRRCWCCWLGAGKHGGKEQRRRQASLLGHGCGAPFCVHGDDESEQKSERWRARVRSRGRRALGFHAQRWGEVASEAAHRHHAAARLCSSCRPRSKIPG